MTIKEAIQEIRKFWNTEEEPFLFGESDNSAHIDRIEKEFGVTLPEELRNYIANYAPAEGFYFVSVGNPLYIYGVDNLKYKQDGYNYNSLTKSDIEDWNRNSFIFGDEGADPLIVNLENIETGIERLEHGAGSWDYGDKLADNFARFLLCAAAQHHALTNFEEDPIIDDENGFNLTEDAAKWYFPKMKNWAGEYYEVWCAPLDNH
ncbi:hypothetical protein HDE68_004074 [Pedobacter cryoconitis]|uniref:Knr4/Smi1-like domain-containing protein n=1 Tax=Pedobacter cryoconitis TaxID=188932 RepID=A0A7W8ZQ61_9SPHI|nr:SMI1/KNR4 family protein [Pedobacter cryoconitis]MBB5638148.1 hypothetical protein [Pedobacter cryoconitis]